MPLGSLAAVRRAAAKVRGRSLAELRERAAQAIVAEFERHGWSNTIGEASDHAFWQWIAPSTADGVRRDPALLHAHFMRTPRRFFAGALHSQATAEYLEASSPKAVVATLRAADRVREGAFDLLGYTGLSFGSPIDWHLDPTTGVRSPLEHWSRIRYLDPAVVGDHKVVWELNRHQHFMVLGRAYVLSGREEYANTFVEQITSWMDQNPPKQGVNWASSLEVAYRLIAWLWSLELFRNSPALTAPLRLRMLKFLHVHACHLERFLSTYFSPNTHLTGEALGLYYAGTVLPEFRRADTWARRGWSILVEQLERQVHPDGVYFEQATYYHRYTADIYLHAVLLAEASGHSIPPSMHQRVEALVDSLADLTRPDGSLPLIGDDDGGRLVALEERPCNDARAALGTAATLFGPSRAASVFASLPGDIPEEISWLAGSERARSLGSVARHVPTSGSRVFPDGGFVVMRDGWHPNANFAVVDCGPHGTANCGHAHADALSIDLFANGAPLFVDPGTYNYTTSVEDRNYFRRSAAHNTLVVDETSSSVPSGPFAWRTRTNGHLDTWWTSNSLNYFSGSHRGYDSVSAGAVHERRVLFVKNAYWIIWDTIVTVQPHDVAVYFHTAVGTHVISANGTQTWLGQDHHGSGGRILLANFGTSEQPKWTTDWVSECYGRRERAPVCRLSSAGSGRHDFVSVIVPSAVPELISVDELDASGGYAIAVRRPGMLDVVGLRTSTELSMDALSTDGEVTWVRRTEVSGATEAVAMVNGRQVRCEDVSLDGSGVGSIEMRRTPHGWERDDHESDPLAVRWTPAAATRAR